jgi:hypothetical protein
MLLLHYLDVAPTREDRYHAKARLDKPCSSNVQTMGVSARSKADFHIQPFSGEFRAWKAAARREGKSLRDWAREHLNVAAIPAPPQVPPTVSGDQIELPLNGKKREQP